MKFDPIFVSGFAVGTLGGIAIILFGMSQAPSPVAPSAVASEVLPIKG
jgi:hypothetical protein